MSERTHLMTARRRTSTLAVLGLSALLATACVDGEGPADEEDSDLSTLDIDWATYNPLSLIIRDQGWLEEELSEEGIDVNWVQSQGSNRAHENLRAGAVDFGSSAGSAALLNRANGSAVKTVLIADQPEWTALVSTADSDVETISDLEGATVAATAGTDPYFFLFQALEAEGLEPGDVTVQNLQHADGRTALMNGDVDAWAGLDPIMASAEQEGAELFRREVDFNTYSVVNSTEDFIEDHPEVTQTVIDTYERARQWAQENPEETAEILAEEADIDVEVAELVITERSNFGVDPVPGEEQYEVLENIGPYFVETGDVSEQQSIDDALDTLFHPEFAEQAEAAGGNADGDADGEDS